MTDIDLEAIASRRIVSRPAGAVHRREHEYRAADGSLQAMDIYYPSDARSLLPAVLLVTGYPDAGMQRIFGRRAKDLGSNVSWAELLAAAGLVTVTYVNVEPSADAAAALQYLGTSGRSLGIDADRIGVWANSGNVPNALGLLMGAGREAVRCATLLFGYMLDLAGSTIVKEMSRFGFVTPADGKSVDDLPADLPLFIARAGLDETPRLNETIDAFVRGALVRNLPITVTNHHAGPHAFDAVLDSAETRRVIDQVVAFLHHHLRPKTNDDRE
jgi:hypothetical protein